MRSIRAIITAAFCGALMSGCATAEQARASNRSKLAQLSLGFSKPQALAIMGTESVQTYSGIPGSPLWQTKDGLITNPYRTETFVASDGSPMEVLYYYTDVKSSDGAITDDELTPLVFRGGG